MAYKAARRASQDERWRKEEEMAVTVPWGRMERDDFRGKRGVRVLGGGVEWHPKTKSFFEKIGNLFKSRKRDEEELFREDREERDDRGGRYDKYYSGEDEVSPSGSLTTASTHQTSVATSAVGEHSRAGSHVPSRTATRRLSRRPTVSASSRVSSTVTSRRSTAHSSAPSSSARRRHSICRSQASSQATIRAKPTKPVPQGSIDNDDISPLVGERDDKDLFDEDYTFSSHGRAKKTTKWSPRDSQAGSEQ